MKTTLSDRKKNAVTRNAFSKAVIALLDEEQLDDIPKGWMTLPDWCERTGSSETQMRRSLFVLIKAGKAKRQDYSVRVGKVRRKVGHFWVSPDFLKKAGL